MKKLLAILIIVLLLTSAFTQDCAGAEAVRLPIVMYHHLSPKSRLWNNYVLPVEQFENDLKYLKDKGYESVSVAQLIAWCEGEGTLPEKPCMITFDDGFESTGVYARPLLEKYGFTAVVAVIGSVADLFTEKEDHMLDYSHLNWHAVKEMSSSGAFEIQCHTFNMHKLSPRRGCGKKCGETYEQYREALTRDFGTFSRRCDEQGVPVSPSIAFPFGFYCADTIKIIKDMGYLAAFTCTEKVNTLTGDKQELLSLCRFNRPYGKSSAAFFAAWG